VVGSHQITSACSSPKKRQPPLVFKDQGAAAGFGGPTDAAGTRCHSAAPTVREAFFRFQTSQRIANLSGPEAAIVSSATRKQCSKCPLAPRRQVQQLRQQQRAHLRNRRPDGNALFAVYMSQKVTRESAVVGNRQERWFACAREKGVCNLWLSGSGLREGPVDRPLRRTRTTGTPAAEKPSAAGIAA